MTAPAGILWAHVDSREDLKHVALPVNNREIKTTLILIKISSCVDMKINFNILYNNVKVITTLRLFDIATRFQSRTYFSPGLSFGDK